MKALMCCHSVNNLRQCKQICLQAWNNAHAGLLVSERLVNAPPQLAPPLNQALFEEIEWAREDEPSKVSSFCHVPSIFSHLFPEFGIDKAMLYAL